MMRIQYRLLKEDGFQPTINVNGLDVIPKVGEIITIFADGIESSFQVSKIEYYHLHHWVVERDISNTTIIVHANIIAK